MMAYPPPHNDYQLTRDIIDKDFSISPDMLRLRIMTSFPNEVFACSETVYPPSTVDGVVLYSFVMESSRYVINVSCEELKGVDVVPGSIPITRCVLHISASLFGDSRITVSKNIGFTVNLSSWSVTFNSDNPFIITTTLTDIGALLDDRSTYQIQCQETDPVIVDNKTENFEKDFKDKVLQLVTTRINHINKMCGDIKTKLQFPRYQVSNGSSKFYANPQEMIDSLFDNHDIELVMDSRRARERGISKATEDLVREIMVDIAVGGAGLDFTFDNSNINVSMNNEGEVIALDVVSEILPINKFVRIILKMNTSLPYEKISKEVVIE